MPPAKLAEFEAAVCKRLPAVAVAVEPRQQIRHLKRSLALDGHAEGSLVLQTPPKSARPSARRLQMRDPATKAVAPSLLSVIDGVPDLVGRIAEYLFCLNEEKEVLDSGLVIHRHRAAPDLGQLLLTGRITRLMMVVSIKERRSFLTSNKAEYHRMCALIEKACSEASTKSRSLRLSDTGDADMEMLLDRFGACIEAR